MDIVAIIVITLCLSSMITVSSKIFKTERKIENSITSKDKEHNHGQYNKQAI